MAGVTDRAGNRLERRVADYFAEDGLPFGWLLGCKAIHRGVPIGTRMWDAMDQAHRAMDNLNHLAPALAADQVWPFQVLQRSGASIGRSYAVTELEWFRELVQYRAKLEAGPSPLRGRLEAGR